MSISLKDFGLEKYYADNIAAYEKAEAEKAEAVHRRTQICNYLYDNYVQTPLSSVLKCVPEVDETLIRNGDLDSYDISLIVEELITELNLISVNHPLIDHCVRERYKYETNLIRKGISFNLTAIRDSKLFIDVVFIINHDESIPELKELKKLESDSIMKVLYISLIYHDLYIAKKLTYEKEVTKNGL